MHVRLCQLRYIPQPEMYLLILGLVMLVLGNLMPRYTCKRKNNTHLGFLTKYRLIEIYWRVGAGEMA